MVVLVASAGVVVAVVMGLVVWGMSLPVVLAVMGVSVARREPVVRLVSVVVARPGPQGRRQRWCSGDGGAGDAVRLQRPGGQGHRLGWQCRR
ncbi:hypothetical protein MMRN_46210 [Mycobacterium marinum]|nr:hypothetical protein MMRN_46210 [Mycobacterium marinum]